MATRVMYTSIFVGTISIAAVTAIMYYYPTSMGASSYSNTLKRIKPPHPIKHMGIIMDGNRRWARKHGYKPWIGHKNGVEPVKNALQFCIDNHIPYLTLYVFSLENFNRPEDELSYLFDVLAKQISEQELNNLFKQGIKVSFVGDRSLFPEKLKPLIEKIEEKTRNGTALFLQLLFCYGGKQELVAACKHIAEKCSSGALRPDQITDNVIKEHLWSSTPYEPDLIIRTAGDQRLSNFLTWGSAYSELVFLPCLWPELTQEMLAQTLLNFYTRKRTFGR